MKNAIRKTEGMCYKTPECDRQKEEQFRNIADNNKKCLGSINWDGASSASIGAVALVMTTAAILF